MMRFLTLLGTPSIPLLALVLDVVMRRRVFSARERRALLWLAAVVAIILYSSTLGYLPVDVYRAGFSPWTPVVLVAFAIASRSLPLAVVALSAIIAYDIPLFRSVNLFDYLVDPILGMIAIVWAVLTTARRLLLAPLPAPRGEGGAAGAG
jgi:hypothetical protein